MGAAMRLLRLISGAFAASVCIATPALAAHEGKPVSAHQNGYVTRSNQRMGVYNFAPVSPALASPPTEISRDTRTWVGDPAGRPYVYIPGQASGHGGF